MSEWVLDKTTNKCSECNIHFNIIKRKHHCRNCGKIFCNNCSKNRIIIPNSTYTNKERVCVNCYNILQKKELINEKTNIDDEIYLLQNNILSIAESTINSGINTTEILIKQSEQTHNDLKKMECIDNNIKTSEKIIDKISNNNLFSFYFYSKNNTKQYEDNKISVKKKINIYNKKYNQTNQEKNTEDFYDILSNNLDKIQNISKNHNVLLKNHINDLSKLNNKIINTKNKINNNIEKIKKI
jgi:hypothetical protein